MLSPKGSCPSHLALQASGSEDHTFQELTFLSLTDLPGACTVPGT